MERVTRRITASVDDEEPKLRDIDELDLPLGDLVQGVDARVTCALHGFEPRPIIYGTLEAKVPMMGGRDLGAALGASQHLTLHDESDGFDQAPDQAESIWVGAGPGSPSC